MGDEIFMPDITEISAASFHSEVTEAVEPVVVEFYSETCPHCTMFKPVYEELSEILKGVKFVKLNVPISKDHEILAQSRGVRQLPTLEVFYKGRAFGSVVGYHDLDSVNKAIQDILSRKDENIGPSTPFKYSISSS